jgi:hypothetical protein
VAALHQRLIARSAAAPLLREAPPRRSLRPAATTSRAGAHDRLRSPHRSVCLLIAAQAAYHFRDSIVTFWPVDPPGARAGLRSRRMLAASAARCGDELPVDRIVDLQADPAHRGLLILTATVRNRAGWPLAFPHLELTLTDAQDRVVVRRALAPPTTRRHGGPLARHAAPTRRFSLKVFIDASATLASAVPLYLFYP